MLKFNYSFLGGDKLERNKLRGRIVEKYRGMKNFAKALNITNVTLSNKINGKATLNEKDIIKMSTLLDIPFEEIGVYFFT